MVIVIVDPVTLFLPQARIITSLHDCLVAPDVPLGVDIFSEEGHVDPGSSCWCFGVFLALALNGRCAPVPVRMYHETPICVNTRYT